MRSCPEPCSPSNERPPILRLLATGHGQARRRRDRGLARPGEEHRPRHPPHPASRWASSSRTASGQVPLGAALLHLGTSYLDVNELRSRAINWADPLAARSGEAVRIGHRCWRAGARRAPRVPSRRQRCRPSTWAACCRCTPPRWARCCSPSARPGRRPARRRSTRYTRRTTVDPAALRRDLAAVREPGWALEVEELTPGEAGIAAPDPRRRRPGRRRHRHLRRGRPALRHPRAGARTASWWPTSATPARGRLPATSGSYRGGRPETEVRGRDRPGHDLDPLHPVRPARPARLRGPARAPAALPEPGLGRARRRGDLAQRRTRLPRRRWRRRARAGQVAAIGIANQRETTVRVGPAHRGAGRPRHRVAGHPHRRHWSRSSPAAPGADRCTRRSRPAAGDLLLRAAAARGCWTTTPGLRRAGRTRRGAVRDDGDLADLEPHRRARRRTARHRRDQRQPHDAARPAHPGTGTTDLLAFFGIPRAMLPEVRSSVEVYGTASRGAAGRPHRRGARRSAGGAVRADLLHPRRGQVHVRHRQLPAAEHRQRDRAARRTGCSPPWPTRWPDEPAVYALEGSIAITGCLVQWFRDSLGLISSAAEIETLARTVEDNGGCYIVPAFSRAVRPALAQRGAGPDRRAHLLHHQGPPRPRRAGGDRLADPRGRRRHERRLRARPHRRCGSTAA